MDLHQINLVKASLAVISGQEAALSASVHRRLIEFDPTVRIMFTDNTMLGDNTAGHDPAAQDEGPTCEFVSELAVLVGLLGQVDQLIERSSALGRRHLSYGVAPRHYATMLDALLAEIGELLGDEFTPDVALAWRRAFNLIAETMMMGARW